MVSTKPHSDQSAFTALVSGEERGLAYFFSRYYPRLVQYAARLVGEGALAEEVVSDAFIRLWKIKESLREEEAVRPLLYTIVRNLSIDELRKARLRRKKAAAYQPSWFTERTVYHCLVAGEALSMVVKGLERLPPACKRVAELSFLFQFTDRQIARHLGLSPNTVKNHRLKARSALEALRLPFLTTLCIALLGG